MVHPDLLRNTLSIAGYGMLGVFLVTGVLIGMVALLNAIADRKKCDDS